MSITEKLSLNKKGMIIREASLKDIPWLIDFQLKLAIETEDITLDLQELTTGVHHLLKDPNKGKFYVAEAQDEIAGCLSTTYEFSEWRDGTVLWIQSVYVAEKFRGQGVYKKMYQHIQDLVNGDHSLHGIRLYVNKANQSAQRTYEKLGMNGEHYHLYEWMKV